MGAHRDSRASGLTFADARVDAGEGGRLIAAMRAEIGRIYEGVDLEGKAMPKAGPAELGPPRGAFIVGWREGEPVCCGGVKNLGEGACEIKRMYVVPEARGAGVGRALLAALEERAQALGYSIARLDTGPRQPHALELYQTAGYRPIGNFNGNPVATFFAEKSLAGR